MCVLCSQSFVRYHSFHFICSFLDKIYVLSSAEAMEKFLKNPRPYLMAPQPRPPCKLAILGPPLAGKTTLAHLLAQKYGAKVNLSQLVREYTCITV